MKKKIILLCLLIISSIDVFSQINTITGKLIDRDTKEGVMMVTVQMLTEDDSTYISGVLSDENGKFKLTAPKRGNYILKFTCVGYIPLTKTINVSTEKNIALGDITGTNKLGEVFTTLKRILLVSMLIELVGAIWIYLSLDINLMPSTIERIFFSIFHAVSAYCNAGFSTLPHGIMEDGYMYNYPFQLSLILLLVLGGMGFPIVLNILKYIKHLFKRLFKKIFSHEDLYKPWVLTLGSRVNLWMIAFLVIGGTLFIFINEYDNILRSHQGIGKLVTALFTATSPRTAGFNSINYSDLNLTSIFVVIILMWIGASPASTGGGIKTSTFAVTLLNIISLVKGKTDIEIYKRRISNTTIQRAFATMALSLLVIGAGVILISYFDNNLKLLDIIFECFSAYSTVGLSLGITEGISTASKLVLIIIMFIGRVTMLTILIALFRKARNQNYKYPVDEILIN